MTTFCNISQDLMKTDDIGIRYCDILQSIDNKLDEVFVRLSQIENRIEKIDLSVNIELSEIKDSANQILEIRDTSFSLPTLPPSSLPPSFPSSLYRTSDSGSLSSHIRPELGDLSLPHHHLSQSLLFCCLILTCQNWQTRSATC